MLQRFGLVFACLTGAGIFLVLASSTAGCYLYAKRQSKGLPVRAAKSAFAIAMSDPMMVAAGLQIVRAVGLKRLLPLLAVGAIAFGLMVQRKSPADSPAE